MATLEELFRPSDTPQESDWFILNENGQRERPMTEEDEKLLEGVTELDMRSSDARKQRQELEFACNTVSPDVICKLNGTGTA